MYIDTKMSATRALLISKMIQKDVDTSSNT